MTDWTTPGTWTGTPSELFFNTHIRDNLNYLKERTPAGMAASANIEGVGGGGTSEEWNTATTGLTWTPSNPTTVDSNTTLLSHLYIAIPTDSTERLGTKSWAPGSGEFDARLGSIMMGSSASAAATSNGTGLLISDSGHSNRLMVRVSLTYNTGATTISAFTYTASAYTQRGSTITAPTVPIYARITRDGSNNCSFYWSTNGILWNLIATQSFTLTVANLGLRIIGNGTSGGQSAMDWLRTSV